MRFGLDLFPAISPQMQSGAQYFQEALNLVECGDQLGYEFAKIVEHHFDPYGGYSPSPLIFLAAASQRSKHMRLMTGCDLPIFYHPLRLAGEIAMVDCITQGRLDVGLARAFIPQEFFKFGVNPDESRTRFDEGYEAVRRLLTEEHVTFHGPHHQFDDVTILPRPVQSPPPFWIAAVATAKSFENAGRIGANLMVVPYLADYDELAEMIELYRSTYRASGHPETGGKIMMVLHCYIAEDGDQARREAKSYMETYIRIFLEAVRPWATLRSPAYTGYHMMVKLLEELTYERVVNERRALIGSPSEVADGLRYIQQTFGPTDPNLQVNWCGISEANARRTLHLFAEHVMPQFKHVPTGAYAAVRA